MSLSAYRTILYNGLWKQNTGLVQLLGLCPILAVSTTFVNAVSLGLATTLVMICSNGAISLLRHWIPHEIRIPIFILIIASLVSMIDLCMNAFVHELYIILGIFIPLIVTNCIVLARTESFASKNPPLLAMFDGLAMGLGLTMVLGCLGALRELVGKGTVLSGIDLIFGKQANTWVIHLVAQDEGFLLALLPPGAFLGLGLMIAVRQWWMQRHQNH